MKRVIIDARTVTTKKSGIGNYADALIRHLVPLATDLRFTLIRQPGDTWLIVMMRSAPSMAWVYSARYQAPRAARVGQ